MVPPEVRVMVTPADQVRVMVTSRHEMPGYGHSTDRIRLRLQKMSNYRRLQPQQRLDNEVQQMSFLGL
jgi:hypothetical protein